MAQATQINLRDADLTKELPHSDDIEKAIVGTIILEGCCIRRKVIEWEWYSCPEMVSMMLHFVMMASFEDKKWKGIVIKRGQLVIGRKETSKKLGITEQTFRTCLERLKECEFLTTKTTNKYTIVTICNYDDYQRCENPNQPSKQPTANQQLTTSKQLNNNIDSNKLESCPSKGQKADIRLIPSKRLGKKDNTVIASLGKTITDDSKVKESKVKESKY